MNFLKVLNASNRAFTVKKASTNDEKEQAIKKEESQNIIQKKVEENSDSLYGNAVIISAKEETKVEENITPKVEEKVVEKQEEKSVVKEEVKTNDDVPKQQTTSQSSTVAVSSQIKGLMNILVSNRKKINAVSKSVEQEAVVTPTKEDITTKLAEQVVNEKEPEKQDVVLSDHEQAIVKEAEIEAINKEIEKEFEEIVQNTENIFDKEIEDKFEEITESKVEEKTEEQTVVQEETVAEEVVEETVTPNVEEKAEEQTTVQEETVAEEVVEETVTPNVEEKTEEQTTVQEETVAEEVVEETVTPKVEEKTEEQTTVQEETVTEEVIEETVTPNVEEKTEEQVTVQEGTVADEVVEETVTSKVEEKTEEQTTVQEETVAEEVVEETVIPNVEEKTEEQVTVQEGTVADEVVEETVTPKVEEKAEEQTTVQEETVVEVKDVAISDKINLQLTTSVAADGTQTTLIEAKETLLLTGVFGGKYFKDGELATGTYAGKYYENGKLFSGKAGSVTYVNGSVVSGTASTSDESSATDYADGYHGGLLFKDGSPYSGYENDLMYVNGVLYTGEVSGMYFRLGALATGIFNGTYYEKGMPVRKISTNAMATTLQKSASRLVVKGRMVTGLYNGKYYERGLLATGYCEGRYYVSGEPYTGTMSGLMYVDGLLYTGLVGDKYYKDGKPFTGEIDGDHYENGELIYGVHDRNGIVYPNAEGNIVYFNESKTPSYTLEKGQIATINVSGEVTIKDSTGKIVKEFDKNGNIIQGVLSEYDMDAWIDPAVGYDQGNTGDCWVLATIGAFNSNDVGKTLIGNAIGYDEERNIIVTVKLGEYPYISDYAVKINKADIDKYGYTDDNRNDPFSNGDNDALALELAAAEIRLLTMNGTITNNAYVDHINDPTYGIPYTEDQNMSVNGGWFAEMAYYLSGIRGTEMLGTDVTTSTLEYLKNNISHVVAGITLVGQDDEHPKSNQVLCVDGKLFDCGSYYLKSEEAHVISIVGVTSNTVTLVNPWYSTTQYTMTWDAFFNDLNMDSLSYTDLMAA